MKTALFMKWGFILPKGVRIMKLDKKELCRLYFEEQKSMVEIGKQLGVDSGTICRFFQKNNIKARPRWHKSKSERLKLSLEISKRQNGNFNGVRGHTKIVNGYVQVYYPKHPYNSCGYVCEHRLVVENHIGRYLRKDEVVHHINGIKDDNRIENLQIMTNSEHMKLHSINSPVRKYDKIDKDELYKLYVIEKKSTSAIGEIFNVSKFTISRALKENGIPIREGKFQKGHKNYRV